MVGMQVIDTVSNCVFYKDTTGNIDEVATSKINQEGSIIAFHRDDTDPVDALDK